MILFLNFIPIKFMGGTEKWMNSTAKKIGKHEYTRVISMHPRIANLYGMLVSKRKFDRRIKESEVYNHLSLTQWAFIPFTQEWQDTRKVFSQARIIYTRYEILELLIVIYFLGLAGLKKTIVGIHSPFIYTDQIRFFDTLHNALYGSKIYKYVFQNLKKIHVLNKKDKKYFVTKLKLHNVSYVPNGVELPKGRKEGKIHHKKLKVLFVGELSLRKGIDILLKIIAHASKNITFTIAGDGFLQTEVIAIMKKHKNVNYKGYADKHRLDNLYLHNDVLILPSRAESMSLAVLEGMSYGLVVVNSNDIKLGLDRKVEYSCDNKNIKTYQQKLNQLSNMKKLNTLSKEYVENYFKKNFLSSIVDQKLSRKIFDIAL